MRDGLIPVRCKRLLSCPFNESLNLNLSTLKISDNSEFLFVSGPCDFNVKRRKITTAFSCGARSAFKLKKQDYLRSMLSRRQLQGFVSERTRGTNTHSQELRRISSMQPRQLSSIHRLDQMANRAMRGLSSHCHIPAGYCTL